MPKWRSESTLRLSRASQTSSTLWHPRTCVSLWRERDFERSRRTGLCREHDLFLLHPPSLHVGEFVLPWHGLLIPSLWMRVDVFSFDCTLLPTWIC